MFDLLLGFASDVLGSPLAMVRDWSWPKGKSKVIEVADDCGRRWFVKQHGGRVVREAVAR